MARYYSQNAKGERESDLPPISVHNFTPLEFPEKLPSGRRLESRPSKSLKDIFPFSILVITREYLEAGIDYEFLFQHVGVMLWESSESDVLAPPAWVDIRLSANPTAAEIGLACNHMQRLLELKEQCLMLHNTNAITETRNRQLNQIGVALISEKNLSTLLNLILEKAMELTGSDAGCLYLVEPKDLIEPNALVEPNAGSPEVSRNYWADKQIRFKLTRNASVAFDFSEVVVAPSKSSIIGYTILEGKPLNIPDVYAIDPIAEFRHNSGFDRTSGYRTRSMLTLPMKDHRNQVVGAIQLINKCRYRTRPITSLEAADEQVTPFRQEDVNLSLSLASQASVALLNAQYELDIQRLFEGFINASVTAIESRDPTTSGHSHRVAAYTIRLAECVGRQTTGKYRDARLSEPQLREIRYAALLHDFGKIGVREHILTKAKKLFPDEMERIQQRADYIKRTINWEAALAKVDMLRQGRTQDLEAALRQLEAEEAGNLASVDLNCPPDTGHNLQVDLPWNGVQCQTKKDEHLMGSSRSEPWPWPRSVRTWPRRPESWRSAVAC